MRPMTAILFASMSCALSACAPTNTTGDDPAPAPADAAAAPAPAESTASPPVASETPDDAQPGSAPGAIEDRCNADAARSFVGKTADEATVEQARTAASADVARVLKPGQMVTMEFRAGRLNVDVDGSNVITNVRCG